MQVVAQVSDASIGGPVKIAGRQDVWDQRSESTGWTPPFTQLGISECIYAKVSDSLQPPLPKAIDAHGCSGSIKVNQKGWKHVATHQTVNPQVPVNKPNLFCNRPFRPIVLRIPKSIGVEVWGKDRSFLVPENGCVGRRTTSWAGSSDMLQIGQCGQFAEFGHKFFTNDCGFMSQEVLKRSCHKLGSKTGFGRQTCPSRALGSPWSWNSWSRSSSRSSTTA